MSEQQVARILSNQSCMRQQLGSNATPNAENMQDCLRNSLRPTMELFSELARPNITCLHPRIFDRVRTHVHSRRRLVAGAGSCYSDDVSPQGNVKKWSRRGKNILI